MRLLRQFIFIALILSSGNSKLMGQIPIPYGISLDSITLDIFAYSDVQSFHCFKPSSYNNVSSPILLAIHGSGGNGTSAINDLIDIAERRQALIIAPNYPQSGFPTVMRHQEPIFGAPDTIDNCGFFRPSTIVLNKIYKHVLERENRISIPIYMIGFSAGGQFVSRYLLIRQAYPDSLPIQMAVSSNAYYYSFPTDTLMGVPMPWLCGLIMPQPISAYCDLQGNFYSWNCDEHIMQYYNENYGVLIGTGDIRQLNDTPCAMVQGNNRYERALNFYNFADSNAVNRGTTLRWLYQEVMGVGHDQYAMYNNKDNPNDSSTIAETLLFDSPHLPVINSAPSASFHADTTQEEIYVPINFINTSINATTFIWDFGDSTYSILDSPSHAYDSVGVYLVRLTAINSNGCDNWLERRHYIKIVDPTSVQELNYPVGLKIYPNPNNGEFTIDHKLPIDDINIWDISGRIINAIKFTNHQSSQTLSLDKILPGLYILEVKSDGISIYQKILINR